MKLWAFLLVISASQIKIESSPVLDTKELGEVSQNRPRCDEKHGRCIPMDSPCRGRAMICCDYCQDEDNFKCCIDMCYTYQPCSVLGGTCLSQHDECHGIGVNVENGCSIENSLNCTCCVPHSKKSLIKNWEKVKEITATIPKASNQISPNTKKHSRTGKDLQPDTMDQLETEIVNEETVLMEEKDEEKYVLTSEEVNELVNENMGLIEEERETVDGLTSKEAISEDLDSGGSNEFFLDESESIKDEEGLKNNVNILSIEEKLEDENKEQINSNDDLSIEVEEIIAENDAFNESIKEIDYNNLHGEDDEYDNIDTENDNVNDENKVVDKDEDDNVFISANDELNNDYSFINDENENEKELNKDYSFNDVENENNEEYYDDNVDEDADHIEYNDYENDKDEDKKDNDVNEINSIEDNKSSEYVET